MELRISVLASGAILLNGEAVTLDSLEATLAAAKEENCLILYYRENPESPTAAVESMKVVQLVGKYKLPISLSSKADFSNYIDTFGQSHERTATSGAPVRSLFEPHMPDVDLRRNADQIFARVREAQSSDNVRRCVTIVRPDRGLLTLAAPPESPQLSKSAESMRKIVPSGVQRDIAIIGNTGFTMHSGASPLTLVDVNKAVPFFAMLIGLAYIGHRVWIFEGHSSALAAGCRDADLLLVDSAMAPMLAKNWVETVAGVMRNANILLHDRKTFQLRVIRKVGSSRDALEFLN
jgi:hypothetical protein